MAEERIRRKVRPCCLGTNVMYSLETIIEIVWIRAIHLLTPFLLHFKPVVPAILSSRPSPLSEWGERDLGQSRVGLCHKLLLMAVKVLPPVFCWWFREVLGCWSRGGTVLCAMGRERGRGEMRERRLYGLK